MDAGGGWTDTALDQPLAQDRPGVAALRKLLGKPMRITLSDGRIVTSPRFLCTDRDLNIILSDADEVRAIRRPCPENAEETEVIEEFRYIGTVMIPGEHVVRIEVNSRI